MTKVLTSLELLTVVNELKALKGAKVSKIYNPASKQLLIVIRRPDGNYQLKIDSGFGIYLTSYKLEMPDRPSSFCLFLRKHLLNAVLHNVIQKNSERIIELHFQSVKGTFLLICELFSKGNFVLTDSNYKIINVAAVQLWKDRTIKRGEIYKYPPPRFNILRLDKRQFMATIDAWKSHEIVKLLASGLGIGGIYAEEICKKTLVDKYKACNELSEQEVDKIYAETQATIYKFQKASEAKVVYEDSDIIDATPFELTFYKDRTNEPAASFNQALDVLYSKETTSKIKAEKTQAFDQKMQQLQTIYDRQKQSLERYEAEYLENKKLAESIYNNYQLITNIFNKVKQARDAGHNWDAILDVFFREKEQGVYEARLVKNIFPESHKIILDVDGELELDVTKSLEQNSGDYYERAKELKSKVEGAQNIIEKTEKEIEDLKAGKLDFDQEIEKELPKPIKRVEKKWYEKFKWFFTSSGLLAVGGRDATTNDILVKKYLEVKDIVFHTELAGSPFFILKEGREKSTEKDREEVAIATASFSRNWSSGVGAADVYWVLPEQVSKEAPAGQYIGKGAFMIRGKKNQLRNAILEISVGLDSEGRIMSGPKSAIAKHCPKAITVKPGQEKTSDIAKKIAQKIQSNDINAIISSLPAGGSTLQKPMYPVML
jgi:predicted ribosome quality control (RQC) complex YloA/Tae2 family protein